MSITRFEALGIHTKVVSYLVQILVYDPDNQLGSRLPRALSLPIDAGGVTWAPHADGTHLGTMTISVYAHSLLEPIGHMIWSHLVPFLGPFHGRIGFVPQFFPPSHLFEFGHPQQTPAVYGNIEDGDGTAHAVDDIDITLYLIQASDHEIRELCTEVGAARSPVAVADFLWYHDAAVRFILSNCTDNDLNYTFRVNGIQLLDWIATHRPHLLAAAQKKIVVIDFDSWLERVNTLLSPRSIADVPLTLDEWRRVWYVDQYSPEQAAKSARSIAERQSRIRQRVQRDLPPPTN